MYLWRGANGCDVITNFEIKNVCLYFRYYIISLIMIATTIETFENKSHTISCCFIL